MAVFKPILLPLHLLTNKHDVDGRRRRTGNSVPCPGSLVVFLKADVSEFRAPTLTLPTKTQNTIYTSK
jgi:hypothetical protein